METTWRTDVIAWQAARHLEHTQKSLDIAQMMTAGMSKCETSHTRFQSNPWLLRATCLHMSRKLLSLPLILHGVQSDFMLTDSPLDVALTNLSIVVLMLVVPDNRQGSDQWRIPDHLCCHLPTCLQMQHSVLQCTHKLFVSAVISKSAPCCEVQMQHSMYKHADLRPCY